MSVPEVPKMIRKVWFYGVLEDGQLLDEVVARHNTKPSAPSSKVSESDKETLRRKFLGLEFRMDPHNWDWHVRLARGRALQWFKSIYPWPKGCSEKEFFSSDFCSKMTALNISVMNTSDEEEATDAEDDGKGALYYLSKGQRRFVLDSGASSHIIPRSVLTDKE